MLLGRTVLYLSSTGCCVKLFLPMLPWADLKPGTHRGAFTYSFQSAPVVTSGMLLPRSRLHQFVPQQLTMHMLSLPTGSIRERFVSPIWLLPFRLSFGCSFHLLSIYIFMFVFIYSQYTYMIPVSGFVPPPVNGLGPPRRRERSSMLVCVEASQHALRVYIHTHRLYIHTYILTD